MSKRGIKVGQDILREDSEDLVFTSEFPLWTVAKEGTFEIDVTTLGTSTVYSTTITHNLGYVPKCLVWMEQYPNQGKKAPLPFFNQRTI